MAGQECRNTLVKMVTEWHQRMQEKFERRGKELGFETKTEVGIPRGKLDCVWESRKPVSEYFISFEFETATTGPQVVENLVKVLSLPPQMRPRFLVQVYRDKLKDKNREYIETISSALPVTVKLVDNVGSDVEEAFSRIVIELLNWVGEYAEIPAGFIRKLESVVPGRKVVRLFHYGEGTHGHLRYLDEALRYPKDYLLWIKSTPTEKDVDKISTLFGALREFDIVVLSDVSPKYCESDLLRGFLETEVRRKGRILILTGGYGLTRKYDRELGEKNLGGSIGDRSGKVVRIAKNKHSIGVGLTFNGFNHFRPDDPDDVVAHWDEDDSPALIVHRNGKGKVITFTSDCSPAWGTPSVRTQGFKEMWRRIMDEYCIAGIKDPIA